MLLKLPKYISYYLPYFLNSSSWFSLFIVPSETTKCVNFTHSNTLDPFWHHKKLIMQPFCFDWFLNCFISLCCLQLVQNSGIMLFIFCLRQRVCHLLLVDYRTNNGVGVKKDRNVKVIDAQKKLPYWVKNRQKVRSMLNVSLSPPHPSDYFRGSDRFMLVFICKGKVSQSLLNHYI